MTGMILDQYIEELEKEIEFRKSDKHLIYLAKKYLEGRCNDSELAEVRGYYKGLKTARAMLGKIMHSNIDVDEDLSIGLTD